MKISFISKINNTINNTTKKITLTKGLSDNNFFKLFSQSLNFPEWFGNNWNAFNDCMLNLTFDVEGVLKLKIENADFIFDLSNDKIKLLINTFLFLSRGLGSQDNGENIFVNVELFFKNKAYLEEMVGMIMCEKDENDYIKVEK